VSILRLSTTLLSTFLLLWITTFIDKGVIKSEAEAKQIFQDANIIGIAFSFGGFFLIGKFIDAFPSYMAIIIAFLIRGISILLFC
jgi:hypothetical protein